MSPKQEELKRKFLKALSDLQFDISEVLNSYAIGTDIDYQKENTKKLWDVFMFLHPEVKKD
jgi:hypothetical protein